MAAISRALDVLVEGFQLGCDGGIQVAKSDDVDVDGVLLHALGKLDDVLFRFGEWTTREQDNALMLGFVLAVF